MLLLHMLMVLAGLECRYSMPTAGMAPSLPIGSVFAARAMQPYCKVPIMIAAPPKMGDIIIFRHREGAGGSSIYAERVVALAGDQVAMRHGRLYINGKMVPRGYIGSEMDTDSTKSTVPVSRYFETLPNGVRHDIFEINDTRQLDYFSEQVVPADSFFVLGDNRDRSADSRVNSVGMISLKDIVANLGPDASQAIKNGAF